MPRNTVPTLLNLERWAILAGLDPLHFAGGFSEIRRFRGCEDLWRQYDWQASGFISRSQLAEKIAEAEQDIADETGFWPAPVWIEREEIQYPRPYRPEYVGTSGRNVAGRWKSVQAEWGHIISGGIRASTLLEEGATYTVLDADGDDYNEWAIFTIAGVPSDMAACELKLYFKDYVAADAINCRTDPYSTGDDPAWEIKPIYAEKSGTTITARVHKWNLFCPQLQESMADEASDEGINADLAASYVDAVDAYRVYHDPSQQVIFAWGADVDCSTTSGCGFSTQTGCMRVKDHLRGSVALVPGTWNAASESYAPAGGFSQVVEPDKAYLYYRAGLVRAQKSLSTRWGCDDLDHWWAEVIFKLSCARLAFPICSCSNAQSLVERWQDDLALIDAKRTYQIDQAVVLNNPFGTRLGEVRAWLNINAALRKGGGSKGVRMG